jgi:hypothetical protein
LLANVPLTILAMPLLSALSKTRVSDQVLEADGEDLQGRVISSFNMLE